MEERIIRFIAAIRAKGIHVSLSESIDAFNAINHLGIYTRETFRLCLRSTLIKDQSGLAIFDELFPLFFNMKEIIPLTQ